MPVFVMVMSAFLKLQFMTLLKGQWTLFQHKMMPTLIIARYNFAVMLTLVIKYCKSFTKYA